MDRKGSKYNTHGINQVSKGALEVKGFNNNPFLCSWSYLGGFLRSLFHFKVDSKSCNSFDLSELVVVGTEMQLMKIRRGKILLHFYKINT